MVVGVLKITDENYAEGTFTLWCNEHGYNMNVADIREVIRNVSAGNVSREVLLLLCVQKIWAEAQRLNVSPADLTMEQCKTAIETMVRI